MGPQVELNDSICGRLSRDLRIPHERPLPRARATRPLSDAGAQSRAGGRPDDEPRALEAPSRGAIARPPVPPSPRHPELHSLVRPGLAESEGRRLRSSKRIGRAGCRRAALSGSVYASETRSRRLVPSRPAVFGARTSGSMPSSSVGTTAGTLHARSRRARPTTSGASDTSNHPSKPHAGRARPSPAEHDCDRDGGSRGTWCTPLLPEGRTSPRHGRRFAPIRPIGRECGGGPPAALPSRPPSTRRGWRPATRARRAAPLLDGVEAAVDATLGAKATGPGVPPQRVGPLILRPVPASRRRPWRPRRCRLSSPPGRGLDDEGDGGGPGENPVEGRPGPRVPNPRRTSGAKPTGTRISPTRP